MTFWEGLEHVEKGSFIRTEWNGKKMYIGLLKNLPDEIPTNNLDATGIERKLTEWLSNKDVLSNDWEIVEKII